MRERAKHLAVALEEGFRGPRKVSREMAELDAENALAATKDALHKRMAGKRFLDPRQPAEERQALRRVLRELRDQVKADEIRWDDSEAGGRVYGYVERANELNERVLHPSEGVADSNLVKTIAESSSHATAMIEGRTMPSVRDLQSAVLRQFRAAGGRVAWHKVGQAAAAHAHKAPPRINFMAGPVSAPPKERKARKAAQRRERDAPSALTRPETMEQGKKDENQSDQRVERLHRVLVQLLKRVDSVPYLQFCVNPTSFTQSVENFFDMSFLVKTGRAAVVVRDGEPHLEMRVPGGGGGGSGSSSSSSSSSSSGGGGGGRAAARGSIVFTLTYRRFLDVSRAYGLSEPMVPTRSTADVRDY